MKLPKATAEQSFDSPNEWFGGTVNEEQEKGVEKGVEMAVNFGCLARCGGNALACIACGTNVACWAACAGPSTVDCVTRCL